MRLTKEKIIAAWKIRKQIFNNSNNKRIIQRFEKIKELFETIVQDESKVSYNEERVSINEKELTFLDGDNPSTNYFACAKDDVTAESAFNGIYNMIKKFPEHATIIRSIGCLLGGFSFTEPHNMEDDYRIISNTITQDNDNGSLTSEGRMRHPSSHFADNNYFFNVMSTIQDIKNEKFDTDESKIVLRWPSTTYYLNEVEAEKFQKEALGRRFPYKFFFMWTHDTLHLVSLMAYKKLVQQEKPIKYEDDGICQDYKEFIKAWPSYSATIREFIPEGERGDHFWDEMSKLLSVLLLQDQEMKNIQELLEIGNKAIILYGPPGTGKTYQAKELVCKELMISKEEAESYKLDESSNYEIKEKGAWALVQFHPNYTYEDFIGGISPNLDGNNLSYSLKEGIFKKLCDIAKKEENKEKKFIIIIDEINRADLSSVFGELMYAIEYRDEKMSIPNFKEPFVIPQNVYIIGTMNSIDKSLVTFDLALRRRFGFFKIMPNVSIIENILSNYCIDESCMKVFIERCKKLNEMIISDLDLEKDYQIGHAYFGKIKDFISKDFIMGDDNNNSNETQSNENMAKVSDNNGFTKEEPYIITSFDLEKLWNYHLQPLIEEYLGNRIKDQDIADKLNKIYNEFTAPLESNKTEK